MSVSGKIKDLFTTLIMVYIFIVLLNAMLPDIAGPALELLNNLFRGDFLILLFLLIFLSVLSRMAE